MKINARVQNSRNDHKITLPSEEEIRDLICFTDTVAETHNTFRVETPVVLSQIEVIST